ncbi:MalM family protein [Escherichia coli]
MDPAKAYAKGTGNAVPDIPDPVAAHHRRPREAEGKNQQQLQRSGRPTVWLLRPGTGHRG